MTFYRDHLHLWLWVSADSAQVNCFLCLYAPPDVCTDTGGAFFFISFHLLVYQPVPILSLPCWQTLNMKGKKNVLAVVETLFSPRETKCAVREVKEKQFSAPPCSISCHNLPCWTLLAGDYT